MTQQTIRADSYHPDKHREALRLAIGSILSPKRPAYSRSTSSSTSGTASPLPPHHVPPPPHPSPLQPEQHSHTPSGLSRMNSAEDHHDEHHFDEHLSAPAPREAGAVTPGRARFIQTLQGKSAWDALIHGSFS